MDEESGSNEGERNYEAIKIQIITLDLIGRMFIVAAMGTGIGILILWGPEDYLIVLMTLTLVFLVVGIVSTGIAYYLQPRCPSCRRRTRYLRKSNSLYCKNCRKKF